MVDHEMLLRQLVSAPRITFATLKDAPALQGAYVLWLAGNPVVCLKVGIAGPRGGKGLKGRLSFHFRSDTRNSILAKHLASDATSPWAKNWDLTQREARRRFLDEECFFQVLALPALTPAELKGFESFVETKLGPRYAGRVRV